jgi:cell cycle arrest protein BUB2
VTENSLSRVLNTLAWTLHDADVASAAGPPEAPTRELQALGLASTPASPPPPPPTAAAFTTYVQGMNVLAAPLLYVCRSEHQAYHLLRAVCLRSLPSYLRPALPGVHAALRLMDALLAQLDPKLAAHLARASLPAAIYAFPSVLTLSACTPPLPEVLLLWDFLLAWGVHLNLLAVVAQVVLMRDGLLAERSPGRLLRSFPPLRARVVIELAVSFVRKVPPALWKEVVEHTL